MSVDVRDFALGAGVAAQADLATALTAADLMGLNVSDQISLFPDPQFETDVEDIGSGAGDFPTTEFKLDNKVEFSLPYYLTPLHAAHAAAYALGDVTETNPGTGAYQYVCEMQSKAVDPQIPSTTFVAGLNQGGSPEVLDYAVHGVCCTGFEIQMNQGIERASSTLSSNWIGSGKYNSNSGLTIPAITSPGSVLNLSNISQFSVGATDYAEGFNLSKLSFVYSNNVQKRYGPGAGSQDGFKLANAIWPQRRSATLNFSVILGAASPELAALNGRTNLAVTLLIEGAVITGVIKETVKIEIPRIRINAVKPSRDGDYFAVDCVGTIYNDGNNPPLTITVICGVANICGTPA